MDVPFSEKQKYLDNMGFDPLLNEDNVEFEKNGETLRLTICNLDRYLFEALADNFLIKKGHYNSHFEKLVKQHKECQMEGDPKPKRKKRALKKYGIENVSYVIGNTIKLTI